MKNGKPAPRMSAVSTSFGEATTPSSSRCAYLVGERFQHRIAYFSTLRRRGSPWAISSEPAA